MPTPLAPYFSQLERSSSLRWSGRVLQVIGNLVESEGPSCSVGDECEIITREGRSFSGEVVGFRGSTMLTMTLQLPQGIRYGDRIIATGSRPSIRVGPELLGRVIDGTGEPLDSLGPYGSRRSMPVDAAAPLPLDRLPIRNTLGCGVRAIDAFITCGRGQRLGIFGGSGVGKSTLLGMMARGTEADLTVMALIGERGREVQEFLEVIGEEGRKKSILVVSTSDQSPLLKMRAALAATAIAEYFAAEGKNVLLVVDSLTRFAMAQREIGLAAGEPPTSKGYTPSVINTLARLVERAGNFNKGSITAFYTVLMEGDDQQDPVVDTVRSLLDGHVILDRNLALQNHYPPISVLDSLSRLMSSIAAPEHLGKARALRILLASYKRSEDLIRIGAYQKGFDTVLDRAVEVLPELNRFLQQTSEETPRFAAVAKRLNEMAS
ncbi:FliI/YscN family ATPase [Granulicella tundricola]|uniref:ATPase, FliI/YscN family n=1 Tax=Granulicella tundricola (strain ATCC BAA-1859 / DSM 23138 / MP5ACTX9) TaxID=1198114 RepID=E8X640_GRATM|nr:FliI/YscN family ATPase [Granulicella tundricola]ADW70924.1 ATPase, FliI/YscN family [Granulicella tundricola MP5ACTX9]